MSDVASIDFETRSTVSIKLGLDQYTSCPEFEVLVLSGRLPGDDVRHWHRGHDCAQPEVGRDWLEALFDHVRRGGKVKGWNVMFEWMVWNIVCTVKYGWPPLPIEQCIDTMAQAAVHNMPQALDKCGHAMGLDPEKLKSSRGKYLIQRLCVPHKPTKNRPGIWVQDPDLFAELVAYCDQDVVAEESIAKKLRPLTEWQQRVWLFTQRMNRRGVPVAVHECESILSVVEAEKRRLNRELAKVTEGHVTAATNRDKLLSWVNANMPRDAAPVDFVDEPDEDDGRPGHDDDVLADLKGKTVEDVLKRDDLPGGVRRALEIRAAVVQTSTAKFGKMIKVASSVEGGYGRLRNLFTYHGAGTGRWASRGGINAQNFARPLLIQDDKLGVDEIEAAHQVLGRGDHATALLMWGDRTMDAAVSCLRGVLRAPPGHDFIDADYSNVEVRVAAFLAGQHDLVEAFRRGLDPYRVFAVSLFGISYDAVTKAQRQFSKGPVLGGIFGLGHIGLMAYATNYGVVMSEDEAKAATSTLRTQWKQIRNTWYACGDASVMAVENPGVWYDAGDKLSLIKHKNFLWMRLPSGRLLAWSNPVVEERAAPWLEKHFVGYDDDGEEVYEERPAMRRVVVVESIETKTRKYMRHPLIGSSIFQSGVQGTAADILAEGAIEVEAAGYDPVLLAHDECLSLVPEGWGDPDEYGRLMCTITPWREDLPLAFEAYRAKRFKK